MFTGYGLPRIHLWLFMALIFNHTDPLDFIFWTKLQVQEYNYQLLVLEFIR